MRIRIKDVMDREAEEELLALSLAATTITRAALLADRVAALAKSTEESASLTGIAEIATASGQLERLLVAPGATVPLDSFVERLASLRGIVAGGGSFMTSVTDVEVQSSLARVIAIVICELIDVAERMQLRRQLEVMIAVALEEDTLVIAVAVAAAATTPVTTLAGSRALSRIEGLIRSLGGSFCRGIDGGMMIFGAVLDIVDD